jgi:predicted ATPase
LDWTQAELAQRVGYSVATIRKLERDELRPSKHLAELLAQGLDVAIMDRASVVSFARSTPTPPAPPDAPPIHEQRRSNLPAQLTPFFGRTAEIVELTQHLTNPAARLITIVGPGGMGKTRLALAVAQSMVDLQIQTDSTGNQKSSIKHQTYADGVYFVALAPLRAPEHIVPAIAEAINLRFQADSRLPKQQLLDYLRHKQLLLVLDNFEHLHAAAELMLELLQACPGLRMLVTSREQLQLNSETLFVLESMALPAAATLPDVLSYSAVQLFVETARRVRPKFIPTTANAQAIARICQLVGGMPLGIILAAAWVEVLSPAEIVTELSQGFDFLAAELRDLPERQRSMRAVLTQSWQRLTEAERTVFMRLAVFRGGFTRMAAQHVAGASLRMISTLVNKSLVQCEPGGRYTIHEFLRQFAEAELAAADQLDEAGEADAIGRTHALYYLALAEAAEPELRGAQEERWRRHLITEHDNLRATLGWYREHGQVEHFARLGAALWRFWWSAGLWSEGRGWLEQVLEHRGALPATLRAKVLLGTGRLICALSDFGLAHALLDESLALFRGIGDTRGIAEALTGLGHVIFGESDYTQAQALFTESLAFFKQLDDKPRIVHILKMIGYLLTIQGHMAAAQVILEETLLLSRQFDMKAGIAEALIGLGAIAIGQGEYTRATPLLEESLVLFREIGGTHGISSALNYQGQVALALGDYTRAAALYAESLALRREMGDRRGSVAMIAALAQATLAQGDVVRAHALSAECLNLALDLNYQQGIAWGISELASTASVMGMFERAARLWGAEEALREAATLVIWPDVQRIYDRTIAAAHAQSDATTFAAAWAEGQTMTLDEAVAYALVSPEVTTDGSPVVSMNITDVTGLSPAHTASLEAVGAVGENV